MPPSTTTSSSPSARHASLSQATATSTSQSELPATLTSSAAAQDARVRRGDAHTSSSLTSGGTGTTSSTSGDRMSVNPARAVAHVLSTAILPDHNSYSYSPEDLSPATPPSARVTTDSDSAGGGRRLWFNMLGMDGALPADDGMQSLRQQLQEVRQLAVSTEEKAQRMHFLMTQDYMKHRALSSPGLLANPQLPQQTGGLGSEGEATTPPVLGDAALPVDPENPYRLRPGDTDAVFSPLPKNPRHAEEDAEGEEMEDEDDVPDLGCMHYKRNVKVQCFDCQRWFPCRHCHDQSDDLPFPHNLNRKKTQNMLCMLCETPQSAAEVCINCGQYAAYYFCPKCKLWDNDSNKRIYHCDDCGICRVGEGIGKDYVHCRRCNVCISIANSAGHTCIERATEGDCPLCLIRLFESRTSVVSLPCGHYMHGDCYKDLMAVTYKCPVCSKSAVNMELQWKKLDDEIAAQPMPEGDDDLQAVMPHVEGHAEEAETAAVNSHAPERRSCRPKDVWVGCNDCGGRSWTPFHWLGLKCQKCDSYNTNQMAPTAVHETEAERLMRQQQTIHRHDFSGNAVLRDAGIGASDEANLPVEEPIHNLEVPESPSSARFPRPAGGAQSPGRYFVHDDPPRRSSFTTSRFSTPSMPNLPLLSDLPRIPTLQHMRDNLPNMPNVELPRFSPYEMIDSLSRSLSPMRYYLRGLDRAEDGEGLKRPRRRRPLSAQSDPLGKSHLREGSLGSEAVEAVALWDEEGLEDEGDDGEGSDEEDEDESVTDEEESDEEMIDAAEEEKKRKIVGGGGSRARAKAELESKRKHLDLDNLDLIGHR